MVTAFVRYLPIFMCVLIMNAKAGHKCKFQWMFRFFCVLFSIMCLYVRAAWQGTKLIFFSRSHHHDSQNNALYNNGHHFWFQRQIFWHQWYCHFVCPQTDIVTEQPSAKNCFLVAILFSKASENFKTSYVQSVLEINVPDHCQHCCLF